MRTKEDRKVAERLAVAEVEDLQRRHGCRIIASVSWMPLGGMRADVKPFKLAGKEVDVSEAGQAAALRFMDEVIAVCTNHNVVIMPKLDIVGTTATTSFVVVGAEVVTSQQTPTQPTEPEPEPLTIVEAHS